MKKKILYIDMDGVIADFDGAIKKYNPHLHTSDIYPDYEERSKEVYKICGENPNIFLELNTLPYSRMYVEALFEIYDVYFLSTPMWQVPQSYTDKRIWLRKSFGFKTEHKLILTSRKDLNIGDYLIDDRLKNGAGEFTGKHIHFGNEEFPDWHAVFKFLVKEFEKQNAQ